MKKAIQIFLLIIVLIVVFFYKQNSGKKNNQNVAPENFQLVRDTTLLHYSPHALCRMDCRHINRKEVDEILMNGNINQRKSALDYKPCPRFAVEGNTTDGQRLRIIFAQCKDETVVVTVIDLEHEFECDCPGDNK